LDTLTGPSTTTLQVHHGDSYRRPMNSYPVTNRVPA
jgi:hypothetical protein